MNEELLANKDVEAPSKEEQYLNDIKQVQKVYQLEAHQELLAAVKLP